MRRQAVSLVKGQTFPHKRTVDLERKFERVINIGGQSEKRDIGVSRNGQEYMDKNILLHGSSVAIFDVIEHCNFYIRILRILSSLA
jgi:hypothetical protein